METPRSQRAIRNETFKVVRIERLDCASGEHRTADELYLINQSRDASELKLDREEDDLLAGRSADELTQEQRQEL